MQIFSASVLSISVNLNISVWNENKIQQMEHAMQNVLLQRRSKQQLLAYKLSIKCTLIWEMCCQTFSEPHFRGNGGPRRQEPQASKGQTSTLITDFRSRESRLTRENVKQARNSDQTEGRADGARHLWQVISCWNFFRNRMWCQGMQKNKMCWPVNHDIPKTMKIKPFLLFWCRDFSFYIKMK